MVSNPSSSTYSMNLNLSKQEIQENMFSNLTKALFHASGYNVREDKYWFRTDIPPLEKISFRTVNKKICYETTKSTGHRFHFEMIILQPDEDKENKAMIQLSTQQGQLEKREWDTIIDNLFNVVTF